MCKQKCTDKRVRDGTKNKRYSEREGPARYICDKKSEYGDSVSEVTKI